MVHELFYLMLPKEAPSKCLIVGAERNVLRRLLQVKHPQAQITCIDINPLDKDTLLAEGFDYLKDCADNAYDCVVIDAFLDGAPAAFVLKNITPSVVRRVSKRVVLNLSDAYVEASANWVRAFKVKQYHVIEGNHVFHLERAS